MRDGSADTFGAPGSSFYGRDDTIDLAGLGAALSGAGCGLASDASVTSVVLAATVPDTSVAPSAVSDVI